MSQLLTETPLEFQVPYLTNGKIKFSMELSHRQKISLSKKSRREPTFAGNRPYIHPLQ